MFIIRENTVKMVWGFIVAFAIVVLILSFFYIFPWFFGAPFEATKENKVKNILKLARIKKTDKAVDLGSGDGRLVIAMAKRGAEAHGYEINPILVYLSRRNIKQAGLQKKAFIHWKSFWNTNLKQYDVIVMFQFYTIMKKLQKKLVKEAKKSARIVSYYWKFPDWKIAKKIENIYLYKKK